MRDTKFSPDVQIHQRILRPHRGVHKKLSFSQPFPLSRSHKDNLELLTIIKKGNTNFTRLITPSSSSRETSNRLGAKLQE
jgi:hypothetical protein